MSCPPELNSHPRACGKEASIGFLVWRVEQIGTYAHIQNLIMSDLRYGSPGWWLWLLNGIFRSVIVALYPRSVPQVNVPRRRVVRSMFYRLRFDLRSKRSMYYFQLDSAFTHLQFLNLFIQNIDGWMALAYNNAVPTYSSALAQETRFICNL